MTFSMDGGKYSQKEIRLHSEAVARIDRSHEHVHWRCQRCGKQETTAVADKVTSRQCGCKRWMLWGYTPFDAVKVG